MGKKTETLSGLIKQPLVIRGLIAAFLYLLMLTRVFGLLTLNPSLLLDVRLKINSEIFLDAITKQASFGRDAYIVFHLIDYLFIFYFYPFLCLLAKRLFTGAFLPTLALVAGGADLLENIFIDIALLLYPNQIPSFALLVAVLTPLKFLCIGSVLVALIIRLVKIKLYSGLS